MQYFTGYYSMWTWYFLSFAFFQRLTGQETDNLETLESLALEESKEENEEFNPGDDADSTSEEGPLQVSCGLRESVSDDTSGEAKYWQLEWWP